MVISPSNFPGTTGDSANYAEQLGSLRRQGLGVILVCPKSAGGENFDNDMTKIGITVVRVPVAPPRLHTIAKKGIGISAFLNLVSFYVAEILILFGLVRSRRIRFCIMRHSILTLPLAFILRCLGIQTIADGEILADSLHDAIRVPSYFLRLFRVVEKEIMRSYHLFRVTTQGQLEAMVGFGFREDQLVFAKVGVQISRVPYHDIKEIPPATFGFFGTLEKWQGVDVLLRSFAKVLKNKKAAKLYIIGDGSMRNELVSIAETLGITDNVIFCSPVPRDLLWERYFRLFRVCVIPRPDLRIPVNPIKLAESLASGKPVIATAVEGIRDNAGGGVILVTPRDEDVLARTILSLCDDSSLLPQMSEAALKFAQEFDIDTQTARIVRALVR